MKTYRLGKEMRGTVSLGTRRVIKTLPASTLLELVGPVEGNASEVEVLWEGQSIRVFEQDFSDRAIEVCDDSDMSDESSKAQSGVGEPPSGTTRAPAQPSFQPVGGPPSPGGLKPANPAHPKIRRFNAAGRELF